MTKQYLATRPDRELFDFLEWDFAELHRRYGGVTATTFRNFPSFPQRYMEACSALPVEDTGVKIEPLKRPGQPALYTERDLHLRQFTDAAARRVATAPVSLRRSA
jgi:hypothetical protein